MTAPAPAPALTYPPTIPPPPPLLPGGDYYILVGGQGQPRFVLVERAQPIYLPGFGHLDIFLHRWRDSDGARDWAVSEGVSGCLLGYPGPSPDWALMEARCYLRARGSERVAARIAISVERYGISPRYAAKGEGA